MKSRINNRFIFGIVSIALAAVIAFVAMPAVARQANGTTEVVRVTRHIRQGEVITSQDVEVIVVGELNLPDNIVRTEGNAVGMFAVTDMFAGDFVIFPRISATPISSDIQLGGLPTGRVAISLTISSFASGLSDKLQTGDIVRIYHFLNGAWDVPELQFVRVLMATDARGMNVYNNLGPPGDEEQRLAATVTLLATPEQARVITSLENDGVAHIALISRGNEALALELLEIQDEILYELYFAVVEEDDYEYDYEYDETENGANEGNTPLPPDHFDTAGTQNEVESGTDDEEG